MEVLGVTTTLSMWAHFAGAFLFGKVAKKYWAKSYAFIIVMMFGLLWEGLQIEFAPHPNIWWDSAIDVVMNGLGAFIAVRWVHE